MRKNKKSCFISEFCRNNNFRTLEFYKMLSRHPELARKMKANSAGERVLDEEAMMTARAILRKEKIEEMKKSLVSLEEQLKTALTEKKAASDFYTAYENQMKSDYQILLEQAKAEMENLRREEERQRAERERSEVQEERKTQSRKKTGFSL